VKRQKRLRRLHGVLRCPSGERAPANGPRHIVGRSLYSPRPACDRGASSSYHAAERPNFRRFLAQAVGKRHGTNGRTAQQLRRPTGSGRARAAAPPPVWQHRAGRRRTSYRRSRSCSSGPTSSSAILTSSRRARRSAGSGLPPVRARPRRRSPPAGVGSFVLASPIAIADLPRSPRHRPPRA
jgi:hypothetical protein